MKLRLASAILFLSAALFATADETVLIEVRSSWFGLGSSQGSLTITGYKGRYYANGHQIDAKAVESLLAALKEPFVEEPSLEQCGITQDWLLENYEPALEEQAHEKVRHLSPQQVELFKSHFTNQETAEAAFLKLFKHWHTDDYPEMSVSISQGERKFSVQSKSQYPFMLPWYARDGSVAGYNCRISQAIARVLPEKFSNRERLELGHGFRWDLASQIMYSIQHDWDLLETQFKVGPAVAPILATYIPLESAISNLSSVDLNGPQAWNAKLRSKTLPPNLIIGVSLRYNDQELSGVDRLLLQVPRYASLVLSVPFLSKYLADHPQGSIELRYVDGKSLSTKAEQSLIEDLQKHGKGDLATKVAQAAEESAFLEINDGTDCSTRAVVLPAKQVLVWHFGQRCKSVLGLDPSLFQTWDFLGWRSTGSLIDVNGKLM